MIGNEDIHLKNFSLITKGNKISLSPVYDLVNSTIAQKNAYEEMALPIRGRRNNITQNDLFDYFAGERLRLNQKVIAGLRQEFQQAIPRWQEMIHASFLSLEMQAKYLSLLESRGKRLDFIIP